MLQTVMLNCMFTEGMLSAAGISLQTLHVGCALIACIAHMHYMQVQHFTRCDVACLFRFCHVPPQKSCLLNP